MHDDTPEGKARMELARRQGRRAARVKLGLPAQIKLHPRAFLSHHPVRLPQGR
jgi:hypothetical protein